MNGTEIIYRLGEIDVPCILLYSFERGVSIVATEDTETPYWIGTIKKGTPCDCFNWNLSKLSVDKYMKILGLYSKAAKEGIIYEKGGIVDEINALCGSGAAEASSIQQIQSLCPYR